MGAKRYFFIVWLAFAVPWIAGTGFGVYEEPLTDADEIRSGAAGACAGGSAGTGTAECPEKAVASLTGGALDAGIQAVQTDSSRSADTVEPVHNLVDGLFILGPPVLLFAVYCLVFLIRRLKRGAVQRGIDAPSR